MFFEAMFGIGILFVSMTSIFYVLGSLFPVFMMETVARLYFRRVVGQNNLEQVLTQNEERLNRAHSRRSLFWHFTLSPLYYSDNADEREELDRDLKEAHRNRDVLLAVCYLVGYGKVTDKFLKRK